MFQLFRSSDFIYLYIVDQGILNVMYPDFPQFLQANSVIVPELKDWVIPVPGTRFKMIRARDTQNITFRIWSFNGDYMQWSLLGQSAASEWSCNPTFRRLPLPPSSGRMSSLMTRTEAVSETLDYNSIPTRLFAIASRSELLLLVKKKTESNLRWRICRGVSKGVAVLPPVISLSLLIPSRKRRERLGCVKLRREWGAKI